MKNRLIVIVSIIIGLYLIVTLSKSIIDILQKGKSTSNIETTVSDLRKQNITLKNKLKDVQSQEYVEKIARDKLNMAKPGESIVILPEEIQNPKIEVINKIEIPNWQKWYQLFF